ncbi:zinc finger and BTB domain-containing protein 14-like isoform X2 [Ostrinia nubilalis]|uniref:zinc finger and BTB domain-containing protein 14-like isoform X2 n=1 Tax=Ostrinia furnacalis TaxID=93504 RepID=UPI00103CD114|nr:zinc finger and BTB domain-containing protein 14-like isoform X2 [Ostrinia furnacalis]XP_028178077.1 zinc finger and BTB domain-containing protein 14-like isoform X4 [Ostrinia furnacalis]
MDWQLTCRVCLETGDMVSLFDWDENNQQLGDKYTYCCGIKVCKNDSLPTLICLNCVDRLTFAYQFKQQCLTSNTTLKECLGEFMKSSAAVSSTSTSKPTETETITIKQENGLLLQYELPVEHDPTATWTRTLNKTPSSSVVTKAPKPKKRGRPRKYPNEQGQIHLSPYQRKKPREPVKEPESLTTMIASGTLAIEAIKEEPLEDEQQHLGDDFADDDPEFNPESEENESEAEVVEKVQPAPKKRGRPRKVQIQDKPEKSKEDDGEDVLLKETILAFSEPIPEHILNPQPKKKKYAKRKKYVYEKTHTCETCGSSFTSNASLQAHIRRHLGIKPFVCSVCGYACVMNEALKRHMLRHTGERPYKCRVCERRFGDYGTRQKHERLHMGLRPYQCSVCGKSFTYSYVLANHMLTHTGEKKYSCGPCNKKFTKAHHLKYHNKVHHKELYIQQQLEMQAKKMRQQMNATGLSGVLSGQIVDGTLQLAHHAPSEDGEQDAQMQVVEHLEDADKETDRAVADMQAGVLNAEFCIEDDDSKC